MSNTSSATESTQESIANKSALVGIIGLGYVGLPLARCFIAAGFRVLGFDIDSAKVDQLRRGESYIGHIPSSVIREFLVSDLFEPTAEMERLGEPDALLICVPTPLTANREPDLPFVEGTARQVANSLRPGQLVVLESTTYPGTTRQVMVPILEESQLKAGKDFHVAYSPEREDPGNPKFTAGVIPKVVGGLEENCLQLAASLYSSVVTEVVKVSSLETAEACKILENTYRAVNIGMVNELKVLFDRLDIDIWEVIRAASTKPFGYQPFFPGPGLGGHCIPIDPFYLTWLARQHGLHTRFIELAGEINTNMPSYVVQRVAEALNERGKPIKGSKICLLGVAYKKDIDDPRESPSFELMKQLLERGASLSYSDPHVPELPWMRRFDLPPMTSNTLTPEFLTSLDCALIVTDHSRFDYPKIVRHADLIVDTRNATQSVEAGREKIVKA